MVGPRGGLGPGCLGDRCHSAACHVRIHVPYSTITRLLINYRNAVFRGVARYLLRGRANQGIWGKEVPSGVQGQNMEALENTNGAVTKIDLR